MKKNQYTLWLILVVTLVIASRAEAQTIIGPSPVGLNATYTYRYDDGVTHSNISWIAGTGGTVSSTWSSGTTYYASIYWTRTGTKTITLQDINGTLATKSVTVNSCSSITAPTTNNGITCGPGTVVLSTNYPPAGHVVRWYDGVNTNLILFTGDDQYFTTPYLSSTTNYYASFVNASNGCESSKVMATASVVTPPTSNAGADQTGASTCGITTVTLGATPPASGSGNWSVVSGSGGSFGNSASASSTFSGTSGTAYVLRWTVTDNGCSTSDDVNITFNQNPTAPNAGPDQTSSATCGLTTVTLAGNTPSVGSGTWLIGVDCSTGGSLGNASSPSSTFTGPAGGTYCLTWKTTNGACSLTDEVIVTLNRYPTAANAGADQTGSSTCGLTTVTLAANAPSVGSASWSVVSGAGGSFASTSSPTSTFSGTAATTYTLRWTISNSPCATSTDDVVVTFNRNPTTANAGADQTGSSTCGLTTVSLAGNAPSVGTGSWSVVSGAGGSFANSSSPTSTFSGTAGTTYTLRWTISNSPCSASTDDVIITFNRNPTTANAGADQTGSSTCGLTTVTLAGNAPSVGSGVWSVVSGTGGSFGNASSPTSTFSGTAGTSYTLRWRINNSPCIASTDDVVITFNTYPTAASAGADQTGAATCGLTTVTLAAATPPSGTASWSVVSGSGGSFSNASSASSTFSGTAGTSYTLRWTTNGTNGCSVYDDMLVTFNQNPTTPNAGLDQTGASTCGLTSVTLAANTPAVGTGTWIIEPDWSPGGSVSNAGSPTATFSGQAGGSYGLFWKTTNGPCSLQDEVVITFNQNPTTANAGLDQTGAATCGLTSVTLAANTPTVGTGSWSIVSGAGGSFANASSAASNFSGSAGATYTLRWTISKSPCTASTDDVIITFNQNPTLSNAGLDQTGSATCGLASVTLAANTPSAGTGAWSIVSGTGGAFGNASSAASTFSGTVGTAYTLRWTTSNNPCAASTDDVNITLHPMPDAAVSATSQAVCSKSTATITITNPNNVSGTTFTWTKDLYNAAIKGLTETSTSISGEYSNADGVNSGTATFTITPSTSMCTGSPVTATVNVNDVPATPSPVPPVIYGYTTGLFQVVAPAGTLAKWFLLENSATPLTTGNTHSMTAFDDPITYYVSFTDQVNSCETKRVAVTAIRLGNITPTSISREVIRVSGQTTDGSINSLNNTAQKAVTVSYVDGLSRTRQMIDVKASPAQNDIVQPIEYDSYGRSSKNYLPYTKNATLGFQSTYTTDHNAFYNAANDKIDNDNFAFSKTVYEASPLGRPLEQGNAGENWQPGNGHTSRMAYSFNTATGDDIRKFTAPFTVGGAASTQSYADNALSRVEVTDENGHKEIIFTDGAGKTLVRKKQLDGTINSVAVDYLQTVYVYNDKGQLTYIITPAGYATMKANNWVVTQAILDDHLHQFVYDNRGRLTQKKTPGQAWTYFAYDKLNRLVLMQDGNLKPLSKWAFVKYDLMGRAVITGLYKNTSQTDLTSIQTLLDGQYAGSEPYFEKRGTSLYGYTNQSFPIANADASALEILNANYFDDYDFDNNGTPDFTYDNAHLAGLPASSGAYVRGLPTGGRTLILGSANWIISAVFYDNFGRPIQTQGNNHLNLAATDKSSVVYDFEDKPLNTKTSHNASGAEVVTQKQPQYDVRGRVTGITQSSKVGKPVTWVHPVSVTMSGSTLTKTGADGWDAGAFSYDGIPVNTDGWVEFTVDNISQRMLGLSDQDVNASYNSIDYAMFPAIDGMISIYENGTHKGQYVAYSFSDVLRIERKNGIVYYKKNGTTFYTSTVTSSAPLFADAALYGNGSSVLNVKLVVGGADVQAASYEYNELSQLVDKKLHINAGSALQSVDYRYNLRGQLTSINNASMSNDAVTNDDTNDHFGMELLYHTVETGLGNTQYFNNNISAIKWKGPGATSGTTDQRSYKYSYDKTDKLLTATFQKYGSTWNQEQNTLNEAMSYDHNGNILTLQRNQNQRGLSGTTITSAAQLIDDLGYTYGSGNQLTKVTDATAKAAGFSDGANTTTEYTYDTHGNVTADQNKGISNITYNVLGKAQQITFTDGRVINYTYDAAGNKLTMKGYKGSILLNTTDYVGGFVYDDGILELFSSAEGRVQMTGKNLIAHSDGSSTEGTSQYVNVTISTVTLNSQTYIKTVCNQSTSTPGIIIGSNIPVQPGERYTFNVLGYASDANAARIYVTANNELLVWNGAVTGTTMPHTAANEKTVSNEFTIPAGATWINVGVLWYAPSTGSEVYINEVELKKITPEYQYAIADHQGNTRVVFTSDTPAPVAPQATFEGDGNDGASQYQNVNAANVVSFIAANHTPSGSKVVRMNQTSKIGPSKSLKVYPGDKIDMEVWEYHEASSGFGTASTPLASLVTMVSGVFGGAAGAPGESGMIYSGVDNALTGFGTGGNQGDSRPAAYLNFILFDNNYKVLDAGWQPAPATTFTKQKLSFPTKTIQEAGYLFVYLSYDNDADNWVYFDDLKVTHTKTNVIQYNEYYPFGLQTASSWTRDNSSNNFLYNEGSEINTTSGFYDLPFRNYDAALGRFFQVDPLSVYDHTISPFAYARNNPIVFNDPSGLMVPQNSSTWSQAQLRAYYYTHEAGSTGSFQSWSSDNGFDFGSGRDPYGDAARVRSGTMSLSDYAAKYGTFSGQVSFVQDAGTGVTFNITNGQATSILTASGYIHESGGFISYSTPEVLELGVNGSSAAEGGVVTAAAAGVLAFITTDVAIPDPTDVAWPKWVAYGVAGTVAAVIVHSNSNNNKKPHLVYEIYSIDAFGTRRTEKYGITSREDNKDGNNGRPAYQANQFNKQDPTRAYSWQTITRTDNRASAKTIELFLVTKYFMQHGQLPPKQIYPVPNMGGLGPGGTFQF